MSKSPVFKATYSWSCVCTSRFIVFHHPIFQPQQVYYFLPTPDADRNNRNSDNIIFNRGQLGHTPQLFPVSVQVEGMVWLFRGLWTADKQMGKRGGRELYWWLSTLVQSSRAKGRGGMSLEGNKEAKKGKNSQKHPHLLSVLYSHSFFFSLQ